MSAGGISYSVSFEARTQARVWFSLGVGDAFPAAAEEQRHQQMKSLVVVRGKGEGCQTGGGDVDTEFFLQFADQRRLRGFAGVELAAGKLPQAGHLLAFRPAGEQDAAVDVDQGAGGDQQQRFGAGVRSASAGASGRPKMSSRVASKTMTVCSIAGGRGRCGRRCRSRGSRCGGARLAGGDVVLGHLGGDEVERQVGERPAGQPPGGLGGDAVAPVGSADPVAETAGAAGGVEAEADDADEGLLAALLAGDGEVIGGAVGEFLPVDAIHSSARDRG